MLTAPFHAAGEIKTPYYSGDFNTALSHSTWKLWGKQLRSLRWGGWCINKYLFGRSIEMALNNFMTKNWYCLRGHSKSKGYLMLQRQDVSSPPIYTNTPGLCSWSLSQILLTIFLCLISSIVGFTSCKYLEHSHTVTRKLLLLWSIIVWNASPQKLINIGVSLEPNLKIIQNSATTLLKSFEFNTSFSAAPSKDSNRAWAENLPGKLHWSTPSFQMW